MEDDTQPGAKRDLDEILARVAHWLPTQGPLKDFIHHNTLHAFAHLRFHDAVGAAARLHGAATAMPPSFYWDAYRDGRITEAALDRALEAALPDPVRRAEARTRMVSGLLHAPSFPGIAASGLRAKWTSKLGGVPLERRAQPHLFRLIGAYMDQGLATWRMPGAESCGFFGAVARLSRESRLPLAPFDSPTARELLRCSPREALAAALARTVGREELYERYLLETLLAQPGWSGLVAECERKPHTLLAPRHIALRDFAAVVLVAELGCLERELGPEFEPIGHGETPAPTNRPDQVPLREQEELLLGIWHDAFEWSSYEPLLGALASPRPARERDPITAWAFFCIDDRSCSLRRHLEEIAPDVATFGTAGYFGLDFVYRGAGDGIASKHCPAPVEPRHLVEEYYEAGARPAPVDAPWWQRPVQIASDTSELFGGWVLSYTLGLSAALRLAASVFRPSLAPVTAAPLSTVSGGARFKLVRTTDERGEDGLWLGYSVDELADRLAGLFRSMGIDGGWPELAVLFGHGSSSVNNPYFAAYNCGACSGRSGAPNARAFAKAANRPDVRAALAGRGFAIPDSTWFIGALYDTTRDEPTYYDLHRMPPRFASALESFKRSIEEAAARNAAERCRRFGTLPLGLTPAEALEQVRVRSVSLFEPRPEYNHATNAWCVVGRRALTEGLFLDRRAFLSSYDPARDPDGQVLAELLAAVVPVCSGINLEYLFSRLDPRRYGAGTKLPHNVNGLLGVCNGVEGDLLTGLPTQMTEIHDPVRLLVVVEHSPEIALAAARANPSVRELVENGWVQFASVDPVTHGVFVHRAGEMRALSGLAAPTQRWASSLEAARAGRDGLPVGDIDAAGREVRP